jgi:hypothetical protein
LTKHAFEVWSYGRKTLSLERTPANALPILTMARLVQRERELMEVLQQRDEALRRGAGPKPKLKPIILGVVTDLVRDGATRDHNFVALVLKLTKRRIKKLCEEEPDRADSFPDSKYPDRYIRKVLDGIYQPYSDPQFEVALAAALTRALAER